MNTEEAYKELGLSVFASQEQIKKAYRTLAKQWHPDLNKTEGAEEKFKIINQAYEIVTKKTSPSISNIYDGVNWADFASNTFFKDFLKKYSSDASAKFWDKDQPPERNRDTFRYDDRTNFSKFDRRTTVKISIELEDSSISGLDVKKILEEHGIKLKSFKQTVVYDDF
jgi:molecular chaperone DnaJ